MKYNQIKIIRAIRHKVFYLVDEDIIYQSQEEDQYCIKRVSLSNDFIKWEVYSQYYFDSIVSFDNKLIFRKYDGFLLCLDETGSQLSELKDLEGFQSNSVISMNNHMEVLIMYEKDETFYSGLFDLKAKSVKWLNNSIVGLQIINNLCFGVKSRKVVSKFSNADGYLEWEVALNRHGEILKIFGVVDTTLVVCWHRGHRTFGLLGIDLASGQIRWNMDNNQLLDGRTAQLSDCNLFSTSAYGDESYYIELDIRTQQVLRYGEIPHLKSLGLRIRWINWQDNLLYFTAFYQDSFGAEAIGVLDKNSLDLLWWERVSLEKEAFLVNEAPQVAGNKLYVLDSGGTLHIFEKELST